MPQFDFPISEQIRSGASWQPRAFQVFNNDGSSPDLTVSGWNAEMQFADATTGAVLFSTLTIGSGLTVNNAGQIFPKLTTTQTSVITAANSNATYDLKIWGPSQTLADAVYVAWGTVPLKKGVSLT